MEIQTPSQKTDLETEEYYKMLVDQTLKEEGSPIMNTYVERCLNAGLSWREIYDGLMMF